MVRRPLPFPGYSWPITQHMGVLRHKTLYALTWAAMTFADEPDPAVRINEYLVTNKIFPADIRADSGQPDVWRDYQQILSEFGLMVSRQCLKSITLTPLGLAYAQREIGFRELMTLQVLRYQYPNGHKHTIDPALKRSLQSTGFRAVKSRDELFAVTGVMVRPATLTLGTMFSLHDMGLEPSITLDEFEGVIMRSKRNEETEACAHEIAANRGVRRAYTSAPETRRNASDWLKFMGLSDLFTLRNKSAVRVSDAAMSNPEALKTVIVDLSKPESFWIPASFNRNERLTWYLFFGTPDVSGVGLATHEKTEDFVEWKDTAGSVSLHDFPDRAPHRKGRRQGNVVSVYPAAQSESQSRLHDLLCELIADLARQRGASVYYDPDSVDLLVTTSGSNYVIECKSVTPTNYRKKLRYAIGQVLNYSYWLEQSGRRISQSLVGVTAEVPPDHWSVHFLTSHINMGMVSLHGGDLRTFSEDSSIARLLTT